MLPYFLLTVLLELPLYAIFDRSRVAYSLCILFLINGVSWPVLTVLYLHSDIPLLWLEAGVVMLEATLIHRLLGHSHIYSFFIALTLNTASVFIGRAIISSL
ncbi:MAG TPA: hypothetical protein PLA16_00025 [Chitinophagales bacterium]|nr:hypothetical protein [Chitinophagales bacterium]HQO32790.1 hypothetical protein [Chitinophagales bacterium]HQO88953.1 hypothetical protein [Chitinophagales bacterium]